MRGCRISSFIVVAALAQLPAACGDDGRSSRPDAAPPEAGVDAQPDGSGGDTPDAPPTCSEEARVACDDRNDCTVDDLDDACQCVHRALPDGTACDDHDVCTAPDRCVAGACAATPRTDAGAIVGTLGTFGSRLALGTRAAFLGDDRAVFLTDRNLTLVRLFGDRLEVRDQRDSGAQAANFTISPSLWVARPTAFIIPLEGDRVAVVGRSWGIDVYDVSQDRLTPLDRYIFSINEGNDLRAAVGGGRQIWTCTAPTIYGYGFDPASGRIVPGPQLGYGTGARGNCEGLSTSPDGKTLFVATSGGLDLVDAANPDGALHRLGGGLDGQFILDTLVFQDQVAVYKPDVIKQSGVLSSSGYGDVLVLDAGTLAQVSIFPLDTSATGTTPIGFASIGQRLLVEQEVKDGDCVRDVADLFDLLPDGVRRVDGWDPAGSCDNQSASPPEHAVGSPTRAVLEPNHQVVRFDPDTGAAFAVSGVQQGSFERVRAAGPSTVEVHSPLSMHLIDVSQPETPTGTAGVLIPAMNSRALRLEVSDGSNAAFLNVVTNSSQLLAGPITELYWKDGSGLPAIAGSITNDDAKSPWRAAGRALYQSGLQGATAVRVRRFPVSALGRTENQQLTAEWDGTVDLAPPAALGARLSDFWFDVDVPTGVLVAAEDRVDASRSTGSSLLVSWLSPKDDGYVVTHAQTLEAFLVSDFGLLDGRGVVAFSDRVSIIDADGSLLSTPPLGQVEINSNGILRLDPDRIYLSVLFVGPPRTNGVLVLRADDLSEVARYTTKGPVLSMDVVGGNLVFGMEAALAVASPACGRTP